MISYTENSRNPLKKKTTRINEFSKVAGYKVNIQKLIVLLYTCNEYENETKFHLKSLRVKF